MYNKMINVVLDLDATLISALSRKELNKKKQAKKMEKFKYSDMEGYYTVFERPYLQEFLDYLFTNFNVSIWTAASKDYALFIIDKIIAPKETNRKIDFIFFSYHCNWSKKIKNGTKDLTMFWDIHKMNGYTPSNTVILDDYDEVRDTQPGNCIEAVPFDFLDKGSEDDTFLKKIIPKLDIMKEKVLQLIKDNPELKVKPSSYIQEK